MRAMCSHPIDTRAAGKELCAVWGSQMMLTIVPGLCWEGMEEVGLCIWTETREGMKKHKYKWKITTASPPLPIALVSLKSPPLLFQDHTSLL